MKLVSVFRQSKDPQSCFFYRTLLRIAQTMLSQDVHLYACLCITCRYSIEMAKHIKLITLSASHAILVFSARNSMAIF